MGEQFVNEKDPLLYVRWHERVYDKDNQGNDEWWHRRELTVRGQDIKDHLASSTGSHFFHQLVYRYEQECALRTQPKNKWAEDSGLKLYPTFEWTLQGDLLLNTVNVDYKRSSGTRVMGKNLGPEDGMDRRSGSTANIELGPNLLQEFHSDTIPIPSDVPGADNKPTFWKVDGTYLVLSVTCNWRFVQLNNKYKMPVFHEYLFQVRH